LLLSFRLYFVIVGVLFVAMNICGVDCKRKNPSPF
jgi:hypothetical protein